LRPPPRGAFENANHFIFGDGVSEIFSQFRHRSRELDGYARNSVRVGHDDTRNDDALAQDTTLCSGQFDMGIGDLLFCHRDNAQLLFDFAVCLLRLLARVRR
jgi:hypothetical protein